MRFRLHCLPCVGFGLLSAFWMLTAIAFPQTANHRKPAQHSVAGIIPMPADRADDSYAIYSLLMPGPTLAQLASERDATWAIAEITVNDADRSPSVPPQGELKPPPDHPQGFNEAVQDYEANRNTRVQLGKDGFHIDHAFQLVNPETAKNSGHPGVTFFSEVYFDASHDAALVYQSEWCANLCAAGTWVYLEKHGDQWVRRSGIVVPGA